MLNGPALEARISTASSSSGSNARAQQMKTESYVGAAPPLNVAVLQQSHSAAYASFSDDGKPQPRRVMYTSGTSAGRLNPEESSNSNSSTRPAPPIGRSGTGGSGFSVLNHSLTLNATSSASSSALPTSTTVSQSTLYGYGSSHALTGTGAGGGGGSTASGVSAQPPTTPEVILSGTLCKRGHFFKTWLTRHFVLSKLSLNYYRKNPFEGASGQDKDAVATRERKLLKGEIFRSDVVRVEATDVFKNRPFCFVVVVRKRTRRTSNAGSSFTCIPSVHQKESSLLGRRGKSGLATTVDDAQQPVVLYYIQAAREAERQKWIKTLERWVDGACPAKIGRSILQYIVSNEYSSYRYGQKVGDSSSDAAWTSAGGAAPGGSVSPAAQAGRTVEQDFPVLANLIRDMHECQQADEMVYILDQILGEVADGASSAYIKKLIASAGEVKLETSPDVWTAHVKFAYAKIMKALRASASNRSLHQRRPVGGRRSPIASASTSAASASASLAPKPPRLLADARQNSYGVESGETSFHRFYKLGRKLGSGAFSVVHIATHRETRKQVAVKCIAKTSLADLDAKALKQEVAIMKELDHANLVPLLDYYEEPRYYFIVTPLCTGGELFDDLVKRKSYTEEDARVLMGKLASAIQYLHARGIVHRDLKPENILLKTSAPGAEVMIADFGFARSMTGSRRGTACGTPGYVAPEVVQGRPYGAEVDCWSLGVILFILLCGYPPFPGTNHAAILDKVVSAAFEFESPFWDHVSADAKDLVTRLLTVDPAQRLSAADILAHPWMNPSDSSGGDNVDGDGDDDGDAASGSEEKAALKRVGSTDLLPALLQMRKHSLTHENPKIRPSDMNVDALNLGDMSEDQDVELLDRELGKVYAF